MKCIADENLREATAEELYSEEYYLILFSLKIHLEGNNEIMKASNLFRNKDCIKKVWQVFFPASQLHEMQEIDDNMKIKSDYLRSLILSCLALHICQRIHYQKKVALVSSLGRK